jgi:aryl-alcohol dehydrogenase-like predicted oxidoreductase
MQYRTLGRTGVQVSTLVLGAMNFGSLGRTTQDEVHAMVDAALEGGINLIDTADMYSQGESEEMVGKAIAGRPHRAGHEGGPAHGRRTQPSGQFAPLAGH